MSTTQTCPDDEILTRFASGTLPQVALQQLEAHLDVCPECRLLLSALKGGKDRGKQTWLHGVAVGTIAPGTVFAGRYRIDRLVGRGGMGEVYEATDELLRTTIGFKSLTVAELQQDESQKRLRREVLMARQVTHPNVCRIFDFGATPEMCFLTMEFLPGTTLRQHVCAGAARDPNTVRSIVQQLTGGLQAAHDAGVVHRDFKSENVILVENSSSPPRAVITDFGLAAWVGPGTPISTLGARFAGTITHASPEQLKGQPVTPATDVYALGVVLFELVTDGALPISGRTPYEVAAQRLNTIAPSPRQWVPDVDPLWESVIAQCLDRDPSARPARIDQVFQMLYP
jgi:eukaryotic-like serine/threonine-protein kinase